MANFTLGEREFDQIPRLLIEVPGFADSEGLQKLDPDLRKIPGLVCAAFKDYMVRLQEAEMAGNLSCEMKGWLELAYDALERLASSSDPEAQNALVVEVFEPIANSGKVAESIKQRLRPKSRNLFTRWIADSSA